MRPRIFSNCVGLPVIFWRHVGQRPKPGQPTWSSSFNSSVLAWQESHKMWPWKKNSHTNLIKIKLGGSFKIEPMNMKCTWPHCLSRIGGPATSKQTGHSRVTLVLSCLFRMFWGSDIVSSLIIFLSTFVWVWVRDSIPSINSWSWLICPVWTWTVFSRHWSFSVASLAMRSVLSRIFSCRSSTSTSTARTPLVSKSFLLHRTWGRNLVTHWVFSSPSLSKYCSGTLFAMFLFNTENEVFALTCHLLLFLRQTLTYWS